ncbi:MAG: hypothetical protein FWC64_06775 [Treponema sp.]|nr:hypothetical protein [Treponema sp.]
MDTHELGLFLKPILETGFLRGRMERRYARLCRVADELGRLDLKKAAPGGSLEDYVFSRIDFSRYRSIAGTDFEGFFLEGLGDFTGSFFETNFRIGREDIQSAIKTCYQKTEGEYRLLRENPLILSVMRTLETSLEAAPLFTAEEITGELRAVAGDGPLPGVTRLYPLAVFSLDNAVFTHSDGMATRLFISPGGDLSGTFRPANKPWTQVLIPAQMISGGEPTG